MSEETSVKMKTCIVACSKDGSPALTRVTVPEEAGETEAYEAAVAKGFSDPVWLCSPGDKGYTAALVRSTWVPHAEEEGRALCTQCRHVAISATGNYLCMRTLVSSVDPVTGSTTDKGARNCSKEREDALFRTTCGAGGQFFRPANESGDRE